MAATRFQGWPVRVMVGAAVALLAAVPSVPAGAGGDPNPRTEDVAADVSDAAAPLTGRAPGRDVLALRLH